jgi:cell division septal protein FtsQ
MSFFKLRRRNRYYRHDVSRLDSKLRTKLKAQRQGKLAALIVLGICALGIVCWGIWAGLQGLGREMFSQNNFYQIREIVVESTGNSIKRDRLLAYLRLRIGENLLNLDLRNLRREIEYLPIIEKAEVARELPSRLIIRITERVPLANISSGNGTRYQIDRIGVVMDLAAYQKSSEEIRARLAALPEITGASITDLKIGRVTTSSRIFQALNLIQKADRPEFTLPWEIDSIDVSRRGMLVVTTSEKVIVKMFESDLDKQLKRLGMILEDSRARGEIIRTVDLTAGRDVPTTHVSLNQ